MKVLLLGANGQLGWELSRRHPEGILIETCDYPRVDLKSEASIRACVADHAPDWIINAAAYTAVDRAEKEPEVARQINGRAVAVLAGLCREKDIRFAQISTDFVFSGETFRPYLTGDKPDPVSEYGRSKLAGEQAVLDILGEQALIIRTAWLYSAHGNNFVKTMLRLMQERNSLNVVDDQIGTPTWAEGLARVLWRALEKDLAGIFHWTDAGVASWYDFAVAVQEEAMALGILEEEILLRPIGTKDYPSPAKRPFYAVLDKTSMIEAAGMEPIHWRKQLRQMLQEMVS